MSRLIPLFLLLLLSSCFHKNVMSDRADNVVNSFVYKGAEGTFIITKEEVFQATSKESNGGVTNISGYAEYRITSYDIANGKQAGRADMGEGQEKAFTILGTTPGKIWVYSIDPDLGFHCRNPKTMELLSDEKTLSASGALKGFSFARPEWSKLDSYYGWNADSSKLMLSDMQGFHYYFDPDKGTLTKTQDEIRDYDFGAEYFGTTGYFSKDDYVSLRGDERQKLLHQYEDSTGKFDYLHAELLLENDPAHNAWRKRQWIDSLQTEMKAWQDSLNLLEQKYPKLSEDGAMDPVHFNEQEYRASWTARDYRSKIEDTKRDIDQEKKNTSAVFDHPLLLDAPGNLFVLHASDVSDTAKAIVTKVHYNGKTFSELWTAKLPDFYRDPQKADSKGAFETVFSDGNPEFGYHWHTVTDGKLVMIAQLQMVCLDAATGKILWEQPL